MPLDMLRNVWTTVNTCSSASLLVLFLVAQVLAIDHDPIRGFCRRYDHQTAVLGDKLYVDGGYLQFQNNNISYTNPQLLFHDLTSTVNASSQSTGEPILYANLSKPETIPDTVGGYLWSDNANRKFYLYGGDFANNQPEDFELWSYDAIYNNWTSMGRDPRFNRQSYGAGTVIEDRGEGYYLGGYQSESNIVGYTGSKTAVPNFLIYDMIQNTWRNTSGPSSPPRAEGVLLYVPTGDSGLLVAFGGLMFPGGNINRGVPVPMTHIDVYDVKSSAWYSQNATGEVPANRRLFCAGLTSAADKSSHNIYLYGGASADPFNTSGGFDDVYILTLPTFQWIKWYPSDNSNQRPHNSLTCNIINKGQMLIIGGKFPLDTGIQTCDSFETTGVHSLSLGKNNSEGAKWKEFQPDITTYEVPSEITDLIGGGPQGGATAVSPPKGWASTDLKTLFGRKLVSHTRTPTRVIPDPTDVPQSGTRKVPLGAIVGIAVGVPLVLLVVGICIFYCLKRRRRPRTPSILPVPTSGPVNRILESADTFPKMGFNEPAIAEHPGRFNSCPYGEVASPFRSLQLQPPTVSRATPPHELAALRD